MGLPSIEGVVVKNISPPFYGVHSVHFDRILVTGAAVTRVTEVGRIVFRERASTGRERRS